MRTIRIKEGVAEVIAWPDTSPHPLGVRLIAARVSLFSGRTILLAANDVSPLLASLARKWS